MKTVKHNGNFFEIYDSIQELPAERFFKFNLCCILEAGIGSDLDSILSRSREVRNWVALGKNAEAAKVLANMETAIQFLVSEVSPGSNAFVCLVHKANGKLVEDLSDEGLSRYVQEWSKKGLTIGKLRGWVESAKKKFEQEQESFFPSLFNSAAIVETANNLKRRTIAALQLMQGKNPDRNAKTIEAIDEILLKLAAPRQYAGADGIEIAQTRNFEQSLVIIRERLNTSAMTAFQFIQNCEILKAREKASQKK